MDLSKNASLFPTFGLSLSRIACVTSRRAADINEAVSAQLNLKRLWAQGDTLGYPVFRIEAVALSRIARAIDPACSIEVILLRRR
ncbi:hypothetical protein OMP38_33750 [Cohnella ginsengisoli]|uniref:Uncharacterized protein n=1 Tax=Cohnella ginsengisoli TaxID=425004 RepID=A0A9X4KSG8_9BACL|nr:hypothetical protein [Cohnella ginsengisoli]MDG0795242.1 hypothetical protein [Cohnella ginsengisoli]